MGEKKRKKCETVIWLTKTILRMIVNDTVTNLGAGACKPPIHSVSIFSRNAHHPWRGGGDVDCGRLLMKYARRKRVMFVTEDNVEPSLPRRPWKLT